MFYTIYTVGLIYILITCNFIYKNNQKTVYGINAGRDNRRIDHKNFILVIFFSYFFFYIKLFGFILMNLSKGSFDKS